VKLKFAPYILLLTGFLTGCGDTINMSYDPQEHKPVLNPKNKDVIKWVNGGVPLIVTFPIGSPCREGAETSTCTIDVDSGGAILPYECKTVACTDPEIVVDSSNGNIFRGQKARLASAGVEFDEYIYCTAGTTTGIYKTDVSMTQATARAGASILWKAAGKPPIANDAWRTYNFTASTGVPACPSSYQYPSSACTVDPNVSPNSTTTYMVSVNGCGSPISATIRITP
jgi:hypothetical protein